MRWVLWLEEEQRHLVWMRAEGRRWKDIRSRLGCDRTTAWRRWQRALGVVMVHLNAPGLCLGQAVSRQLEGLIGAPRSLWEDPWMTIPSR